MAETRVDVVEAGQGTSVESERRVRPGRSRWRWAVWSCFVLAATGAVIVLILHWQERTLRAAQSELEGGDPRRALALVSYFLDSHPEHNKALALKARALSTLGQPDDAIAIYEQVGAATVEDVHAWARAYLLLKSWSRALSVLSQVLRMEPDHADALHEITGCRVRLGLLQEAWESAHRLSQLPGYEATGLVLLAALQNDLGYPEQSIRSYQQVVDLVPDGKGLQIPPEELFTQYGLVLHNHGQPDEAVQVLEKSLAARPTAAVYFYLGNAYLRANRSDAAEQAWQKSLKLDPGGVPVHEALANSALEKGDTETALKWLRPLERLAKTRFKTAYLFHRVALKKKDVPAAQQWVKLLDELRKRDERLEKLELLMKTSPHSLWANVARAHRFASEGNWQQAADMIQELAREAPQDAFVQELAAAIGRRGPLPPIERIPIK